jgi:hypothetical protein
MANHKLAVGVYARSDWQTCAKSLDDSESVEKATIRVLGTEENTNYDSKKSYFDKEVHALPGFR